MMFSTTLSAQIEDLQVGTLTRRMLVYAPSDIEPNRPLVLSLHGMNQDIAYQQNQTKWETIAKANNFVVVYPAGINNSWSLSGTRDTDFILAIIDEMHERYNIDRDRVYLSGFSMGGMMTYYAATRIADKIAAFAPVAGYLMGGPNTNSSRAIPIIHTHGTNDDVVTFNGVQTSLDAWINRNNCPTTPEIIQPYPNGNNNPNVAKYTWGPGTDSVEVVLLRLTGVGHWHSTNTGGVNTSQEIWDFCKRFSLGFGVPSFSSASVSDTNPKQIQVLFSKPMKESDSFEGFSVKIDNQAVAIESIVYEGLNQLNINLVDNILNSNEIHLSYSNGNVVSVYDKNLVDFSDKVVDNLLIGAPPRLTELTTTEKGDTLMAKFNKKMLLPSDISTLSLDATYNGELNIPILQCSFYDNDSTILVFRLEDKVYADYNLVLSYSGDHIVSVDNALLKSFSDFQVTNRSIGLPVNVEIGSLEGNATVIALTFSKPMLLKEPQLAQFIFEVNGVRISIKDFMVLNNTIRFILSNNLHYGDVITASYDPGDIKSADKGALVAFSSLTVENPLSIPTWFALPGRIEAEDFTLQMGLDTETTSDEGGGLNIGWTDSGDWLDYAIENNSTETAFNIYFRIAAQSTGGRLDFYIDNKLVGIIPVPATGGWQTWQSVVRKITIDKGKHYLKLLVVDGGFNLNYIEIVPLSTGMNDLKNKDFNVYPNPASNNLMISSPEFEFDKIEVIDMMGNIVLRRELPFVSELNIPVNLPGGIYAVRISNNSATGIRKILIKKE